MQLFKNLILFGALIIVINQKLTYLESIDFQFKWSIGNHILPITGKEDLTHHHCRQEVVQKL